MKVRTLIAAAFTTMFLVSCNTNPIDGLVSEIEDATAEVNNAKDVGELNDAIEKGQKNVREYIQKHEDELNKLEDDKEAQEKVEKANEKMEEAIGKQMKKFGEDAASDMFSL